MEVMTGERNGLLQKLGGDLTAAALSTVLISPGVTIIDRALVEKASHHKPLLRSLRSHARDALKHPRKFICSRAHGQVFTLYAATYCVANTTETITKKTHPSISEGVTFLSTFLVNVPLGVLKDVRFAQLFGISNKLNTAQGLPVPRNTGSLAITATLLTRDAITIYGSFQLAQRCSVIIPDSVASHPYSKTIITQMVVPVLSQLVATPLHLLSIDLYNRPNGVPLKSRLNVVWRDLPSATVH
ncbi:uncharacterized protein TRUGW13939_01367 [Talaromyces rugulosus]|uniref:Uncharacterized protein n=1 Tax=Talaromyces rugulosus TaxID=121627 RepID=A0A7H8QKK1_TALRU|nr:uncharacterized protein TRUGW13939_01367 [Talaromyces rugulosus]QKX54282.1 hypothetical protein TRUGW13939_01367 [Talaromyces rugulosus]